MSKKITLAKMLSFVIAILSIVMLFFSISIWYRYSYYSGYHFGSANGFDCLSFDAGLGGDEDVLCGILSCLQLTAGLILLVINIIALTKSRPCKTIVNATLLTANISAFVYFVEGIVVFALGHTSYTFIPWILIVTASIFCYISNKSQPQDYVCPSTNNTSAPIAGVPEQGVIYKLIGAAKILRVYEDRVSFETLKNIRSFMTNNYFGGTKEIYYSDIQGIQYKESTDFILGFIQLETANSYTKDNFNSETSFTYDYRTISNALASEVVSFLRTKVKEAKAPVAQPVVMQEKSAADEIIKYKQLLDQGIITQEEFDAKKKALLDL